MTIDGHLNSAFPAALDDIFKAMEEFEASESRANTGTGTRREGEHFETLVLSMWDATIDYLREQGAVAETVSTTQGEWVRLSRGARAAYVPTATTRLLPQTTEGERWLGLNYKVSDLVAAYPGPHEANDRYSPKTGPFAGSAYPAMFSGLTTRFDGTVVLEKDRVLHEKILLEYKTSKSSTGRQIDGNAHERLTFQVMQYLEVATRYPRCSLYVLTNGAYIRYRNKYHVNFKVQADRLAAFSWFSMNFLSHKPEYSMLVSRLIDWIAPKGTQSID